VTTLYVLIALAIIAAIVFFVLKKGGPAEVGEASGRETRSGQEGTA
jgi:hypothetical protein